MPWPVTDLRAAGFSDQEIGASAADQRQTLTQAGFSDQEIDQHLSGSNTSSSTSPSQIDKFWSATRRVAGAAGDAFREVTGDRPLGLPPELAERLIASEQQRDLVHQFLHYPLMLSHALTFSLAPFVDPALRLGDAGPTMIGAMAGQVGREFGMSEAGAADLARDLSQIIELSMLEVPRPHVPSIGPRIPSLLRGPSTGAVQEMEDSATAGRAVAGPDASPAVTAKLERIQGEQGVPPAQVAVHAEQDATVTQSVLSDGKDLPDRYAPPPTEPAKAEVAQPEPTKAEPVETSRPAEPHQADTLSAAAPDGRAVVHNDAYNEARAAGSSEEEANAFAALMTNRAEWRAREAGESITDRYYKDKVGIRAGSAEDERLAPGELGQSVVTLRAGEESPLRYGLNPARWNSTREVAEALELRQRDKYGMMSRNDHSPEAQERLADMMVEDVEYQIRPGNEVNSGMGWYGPKVQDALDELGKEFPELARQDAFGTSSLPGARVLGSVKNARDVMATMLALGSDGQSVMSNFNFAKSQFAKFRETGEIPVDFAFGGKRNANIRANFANLQKVLDNVGPSGMREFLLEKAPAGELRKAAQAAGYKVSAGYRSDAVVPRAAVLFGAKIGPFLAKLMGDTSELAMDRWWMRAFNRLRGTLIPELSEQSLARFRTQLGEGPLSDEETMRRVEEIRDGFAARNFTEGSKLEKAADSIYKTAYENTEDAPFGASDRMFIKGTAQRALELLKERGHDLTMADLQSAVWYGEKQLYGELGARKSEAIGYDEAARRSVARNTGPQGPEGGTGGPGGGPAGAPGGGGAQGPGESAGGVMEGGPGAGQGGASAGEEANAPRGPAPDAGTAPGGEAAIEAGAAPDRGPGTAQTTDSDPSAPSGLRGKVSLQDRLITLFKNADRSTLMHELGHIWLGDFVRDAARADAPQWLKEDHATLLKWFNVEKAEDITTAHHEQFAKAFERYLAEGLAPTPELARVFERFRDWLRQIYGDVSKTGVEIPDEIRGVMDRIVSGPAGGIGRLKPPG